MARIKRRNLATKAIIFMRKMIRKNNIRMREGLPIKKDVNKIAAKADSVTNVL